MKNSLLAFVCGVIVTRTAWSYQNVVKRSLYTDENFGFSINAPRFPNATPTSAGVAVSFVGPPQGGVADNVNVLIQATKTNRDEYRKLNLEQLKRLGANVIADRDLTISGRDSIEIEFEANLVGTRVLHYLSLAIIDKDRVFIVTCTATPETFPAVETEMRASLASFKLKIGNP